MINIEKSKQVFTDIVIHNSDVRRQEGISKFLDWLKNTDFFYAPASTKYHGAYPGGLCEHSLDVWRWANRLSIPLCIDTSPENLMIPALFHDICKANFYTVDYRNKKNSAGVWEKVPYYTIDDSMPLGHGEKSVMLIQRFVPLYDDEIAAINWHMGFSDMRCASFAGQNALSAAFEKYPLAFLIHSADMAASYRENRRGDEK
ncbi:hydrolase [Pectinatus frisingensis]|uniref:hydrolase n=1 Tax=Pectinatus frisingensis TaxID=865 RepID=UPI0018C51499|nr:hydrolase [Pectinatus frisingensis]